MASLQQHRFSLGLVGGLLSLLAMLLAGCAAKSPASPPGPSADVVRQQLAALEACTQRSQQVTQAALAAERLKAAEADCRTAQEIGAQAKMAAVARAPSKPNDYTVMRGDTLWGISGSQPIYANPFLWPMIYKANRDQIRDPDLIYPQQVFAIPRDISEEEQQVAIRRARQRGKWQVADGPDHYVLEGGRE